MTKSVALHFALYRTVKQANAPSIMPRDVMVSQSQQSIQITSMISGDSMEDAEITSVSPTILLLP